MFAVRLTLFSPYPRRFSTLITKQVTALFHRPQIPLYHILWYNGGAKKMSILLKSGLEKDHVLA